MRIAAAPPAAQGTLLLVDREERAPRRHRTHQHARRLLRLVRRYGRPLAAAAALARAVAQADAACARRQLRRYRRRLAGEFLEELGRLGVYPRDQGRALALLEWQADRESERLCSHLLPGAEREVNLSRE